MADQSVQEQLDDLTEIVRSLFVKTLAFQALVTCLLHLSAPQYKRVEVMQELERRFKETLAGDAGLRAEVELLLLEFFGD